MDLISDKIFSNHYNYYSQLGVETIKQQASQYKQVEEAYQGRAIYELLQNAIDRAESKIKVLLQENEEGMYLIVANDGKKFSYNSDYDYINGDSDRYDFQSLCSIATSTKDASKDIGNKGVGFKSVFSLNKYAEIYTNGIVYPDEKAIPIDFRLYDMFETAESLNFASGMKEKLEAVRKENSRWGIPGYYFPERILTRNEFIENYFNEGYVTVVVVKIVDIKLIKQVSQSIRLLKNFHFYFIPEKESFKDKEIKINVEFTVEYELKNIYFHVKKSKNVISRPISEQTRELGRKAGIKIDDDAKVSIYFRESMHSGEGHFYNFLPTEMKSVFTNIDINADFHTSVDRKHINIGEGTIGEYNSELLKECLLLIKDTLADKKLLPNSNFNWQYVKMNVNGDGNFTKLFREVFYKDFEDYSCRLLSERMIESSAENFNFFYSDFLFKVADQFHFYGSPWDECQAKIKEFGKRVREKKLLFLPDTKCTSQRIFYRRDQDDLKLSTKIDAEFTSYSIDYQNWRYYDSFRKEVGLTDFSVTDEIYSLFWQCSFDGSISDTESFSEVEQLDLLLSVSQLLQIEKNDSPQNATWRFDTIPKGDIEVKTRGAFALSTLFYKTKEGKYLPGQMLRKTDIDDDFLSKLMERTGREHIDSLLLKTGVSLSEYIFADKRLVESFKSGVEYIPGILKGVRISKRDVWRNIRIYKNRWQEIIPALINENYSIFKNIPRKKNNRGDFNNLFIGNYNKMPEYYDKDLKEHLSRLVKQGCQKELFRFYNNFYNDLLKRDIAIVKKGKNLELVESNSSYYVVDHKILMNENVDISIPLLYSVVSEEEVNKSEILRGKYKSIAIESDENFKAVEESDFDYCSEVEEFLSDTSKQASILVKISQSRISEHDFENNAESRGRFYTKLREIKPKYLKELHATCVIANEKYPIGRIPYLHDKNNLIIEIDDDESTAKNKIARALSMVCFASEKFSDFFELVIFNDCYVAPDEQKAMLNVSVTEEENDSESNDGLFEPTVSQVKFNPEEALAPYYNIEDLNLSVSEYINTGFDSNLNSRSDGYSPHVTGSMQQTGLTGEYIVASGIARNFMKEYPDKESRKNAIGKINDFLKDNHFEPLKLINEDFDELCILNALWYTKHGTKPFDIVTLIDGRIRLIEVKSTRGNNILHFSKRESKLANLYNDKYEVMICDISNDKIYRLGNPLPEKPIFSNSRAIVIPRGYDVVLLKK